MHWLFEDHNKVDSEGCLILGLVKNSRNKQTFCNFFVKSANQIVNGRKGYRYSMPNKQITNCNVLIDSKNVFDQSLNNSAKTLENLLQVKEMVMQ